MTPASETSRASDLVRVYLEMRPALLRAFAAKLRSMTAAEDVVQELYLRASAATDPATVQEPRAWLYRMGSNILIDMQRSGSRRAARDEAWVRDRQPSQEPGVVADPSPETVVADRQRLAQVMACVEEMPPRMAEAFRLHRLQGLSCAQVADRMKISTKAVEKHLAAALQRLTAQIGEGER